MYEYNCPDCNEAKLQSDKNARKINEVIDQVNALIQVNNEAIDFLEEKADKILGDKVEIKVNEEMGDIKSSLDNKANNYDINRLTNAKDVTGAINELFTNVSNGKELIAEAITDKGIDTSASDTFEQMAENIGMIGFDIIKDKLIFNLDARGNVGTNNTTLTDKVNGYIATLQNSVILDPIQWVNSGLRLKKDYYLKVDTQLKELVDENNGFTFEVIYQNQPRSLFRVANNAYLSLNTANNHLKFPYIAIDGTKKNKSLYNHNMIEGITSNLIDPKGYVHTFVTYSKDGVCKIYHNGYETLTPIIPDDYKCFDTDILGSFAIRANDTTDIDNAHIFTCLRVYNKELTKEEMNNNYKWEQIQSYLTKNDILPNNVTLEKHTNINIFNRFSPNFIKSEKVLTEYSIENDSIVDIENGKIFAKNEGSTNIIVVNEYKGNSISTPIALTVGKLNLDKPIQNRTPNKITIVNKPTSLIVNEEYPLNGFLENHHPFMDNLIKYSSDNVDVCSVHYGVLKANSAGTANITVSDVDGIVTETFEVTIVNKNTEVLNSTKIYNVNPNDYNISLNNSNSTDTTNGIIDALDFASKNGYKKIIFPFGNYLINPLLQKESYPYNHVIKIPSNLVIDFSNSILNVEPQQEIITNGYHIFIFHDTENSKIINAKIFGDRYTSKMETSTISEQCTNVEFINAKYCGLENCTIGSSPGFNIKSNRFVESQYGVCKIYENNIESGSYNDDGSKDDTNVSWRWRTINPIDVSSLKGHFELGNVWGYGSYMIAGRVYDIIFYDENDNIIEYKKGLAQFYRYDLPSGSKKANLVFHQEAKPSGKINTDVTWLISLYSLREPYKCFIRNCTIQNNFSTGIAMCGGKHWLMEGNTFINNTGRDPSCSVDYEDGWDSMNGDVWRNNTFDINSIIVNAGNNLVFHNNTFNGSGIDLRNRSLNWRVYLNTFNNLKSLKLGGQSDCVIAQNICHRTTIPNFTNYHGTDSKYILHNYNNYL